MVLGLFNWNKEEKSSDKNEEFSLNIAVNNALSGIGAGLSGKPEDWTPEKEYVDKTKDGEKSEKEPSTEEPQLLSKFHDMEKRGECSAVNLNDLDGVTNQVAAQKSAGAGLE